MMGFICSCVAVVILCFLNFLHLKFFYKYASPDDEFLRWYKNNGCANCVIISLATSLTFKFYRLVHSKFLGRNELSNGVKFNKQVGAFFSARYSFNNFVFYSYLCWVFSGSL